MNLLAAVNPESLTTGALIGLILTAIATIVGHLSKRRTTLEQEIFRDRRELTASLKSDMEHMRLKFEALDQKERSLMRLMANVGGDLRAVIGMLESCIETMEEGYLKKEELIKDAGMVRDSITRIVKYIDEQQDAITQRAQDIVRHIPPGGNIEPSKRQEMGEERHDNE